jgi:transposase-like protein
MCFCGSRITKKPRVRNGIQNFICNYCTKTFTGGNMMVSKVIWKQDTAESIPINNYLTNTNVR